MAPTRRPEPLRDGPGARLHAQLFRWIPSLYNRRVEGRKRALFSGLQGRVLEIGSGSGANLSYLPAGIHLLGLDPNPHMHRELLRRRGETTPRISLLIGTGEAIPLADASVDAVVSTLVLCSVEDVPGTLSEIRRVLRPGGHFRFLEHVGAPEGSLLRRMQRFVRPVWTRVADGCRPDRDIGRAIEDAGFSEIEIEAFRLPWPIVSPHIGGWARNGGSR